MAFTTITDNELVNMGVTGLPDTPELTTEEMQAQFDEYPQFLKDKFKTHITELEANTAAADIGMEVPESLQDENDPLPEKVQPVIDEIAARVQSQQDWQDAADENFSPTELNTEAFHADATIVTVPTVDTADATNKAASTEFVDNKMRAIGAGDMAKSIYDPNDRGMVETAYKVGESYVESITESEAEYPVPAANDKIKTIIGKINKYLLDLKTKIIEHTTKLDTLQPNYYGECTTAAATAGKEITLTDTDFELKRGVTIAVRFILGNTAQSPTLNVNNTGAKAIATRNGIVTDSNISIGGDTNRFMLYMYNGTCWLFLGDVIDNNLNTTSFNPVQNKQVASAVGNALAKISETDLSNTATRPHASGKYLIYGDINNPHFGKTKTAIAFGEEFNYGTGGNVTNIQVTDELSSLNSALSAIGTITYQSYSKAVSARTFTVVDTISIPGNSNSLWLVISFMDLDISISDSFYVHELGNRKVRSSSGGGGGSINSVCYNGGTTVDVSAYVFQDCTVRGQWQIVRLK